MNIECVYLQKFSVNLKFLLHDRYQLRNQERSLINAYRKLLLRKIAHCSGQRCKVNSWNACDLGSIENISRGRCRWKKVGGGIGGHGGQSLREGGLSEQE